MCIRDRDCIVACPDTALPNAAEDIGTVLRTAANGYDTNPAARLALLAELEDLEATVRTKMMDATSAKEEITFRDVLADEVAALAIDEAARSEFMEAVSYTHLRAHETVLD